MRLVPYPDVQVKLLQEKLMEQRSAATMPATTTTTTQSDRATQMGIDVEVQTRGMSPPPPAPQPITTTTTSTTTNPLVFVLLERYLKHVNRAMEYLEHSKGYEWNSNTFEVTNEPSGKNMVPEIEKLTADYLKSKIHDTTFESAEETFSSSPPPSPILTRQRKRQRTTSTPATGHALLKQAREHREKRAKEFDRMTKRTYTYRFDE